MPTGSPHSPTFPSSRALCWVIPLCLLFWPACGCSPGFSGPSEDSLRDCPGLCEVVDAVTCTDDARQSDKANDVNETDSGRGYSDFFSCYSECEGRDCGDDGCGGTCGTCDGGRVCSEGHCEVGPLDCQAEMCPIPGGSLFHMGCNGGSDQCPENHIEADCWNPNPCPPVLLSAYEIDRVEVTQYQYRAYIEAKGPNCTNPGDLGSCVPDVIEPECPLNVFGVESLPVTCVTWYQAEGYCKWLGKRLCTEAEWENAARGTDGRIYPWGSEDPASAAMVYGEPVANLSDLSLWKSGNGGGSVVPDYDDGFAGAAPVASFPAGRSPFGVLDLAGNVSEWVNDWWAPQGDPACEEGCRDPKGPDNPRFFPEKVYRGGGYRGLDSFSASARSSNFPWTSGLDRGFR